ncbi:MBL fold metallo-hydrolase, partial [Candidatus Bathyarchaeota archaeon]|nr:MBL fold metallo-hydrolase [Candidatus Bathyarchaeota archaeon]NIR17830.1 MBL fold metallo-hydrolase [Desulfobacterales bacterium]NIU81520.1 MBL fold metallo-hydrolase [Candidatus Bathyarchaeota archaeon]NIV68164.1 MBL fold metallo-hydrolase [Candidatus Bathyarchaeota archaeon]NIW34548.1 MBL fold metallo-hydrolase [Candidatus Bathyarchaeota archaeon]
GPTTSVKNLLEGLDQIGVEKDDVDYVAVSHIHIDHGGGAGTLLQHLPNARLLVHARGAPNLARPKKLWTQTKQVLGEIADMYGRIHPVPEKRILVARDGMTISLGEGITLKVLETLGHASHHLSFYESKGEGIFTGDAAGVYLKSLDVVIPTSPPPFHLEIALRSIAHLKKMLPERLYYTHFGMRENGVQRLEDYVNQLELWAKVVQEGMKAGEDLEGIYKRILEEDPSTRKAADLIRKHMVLRRGVVRQSIQGLMGYFEETG